LDEEKPQTLFFLGLAYFANNEIDKAIFYMEQADKYGFEPQEQIKLKLGDLYLLQNEYEKSSENYEKVLSKNTANMEIFIRIIWLNIDKLDNPEKALKFAYKALEEYPNDPMSFNLIGWALTALEEYDNAEKFLAKALELDPQFDAATLNLGWLYEKQNHTILAKEYYKKAYVFGDGNSIASLAAVRYNNVIEQETKNAYYQVDISSP
jgi:tetratricopeptide (TPR) repeat protein